MENFFDMGDDMDSEGHQLAVITAFCDAVKALREAIKAGAIPATGPHFIMQLAPGGSAGQPVHLAVTWPTGYDDDGGEERKPPPRKPPPVYSGKLWTMAQLLHDDSDADE